jgi:hypothetical protein
MGKGIRLARYVRWFYELSLSVYCAFIWIGTHTSASIWALRMLKRGPIYDGDPRIERTAMYLAAAVIFAILRILGQVRPLRTFLCQLAGCAIFLAPLFSGGGGASIPGFGPWLWVECAGSAVAALLYANRRLPAGVALGSAVVLFHFALWGYVELRDFVGWWEYHDLIEDMVLIPLFASVAWGFYVWLLARSDPAREPGLRRAA